MWWWGGLCAFAEFVYFLVFSYTAVMLAQHYTMQTFQPSNLHHIFQRSTE